MANELTVEQNEEIESLKRQIQEREDLIGNYKESIELNKVYQKLKESKEYQEIIEKGYIEEAKRLGDAMINPTIMKKEVFEELTEQFHAIRLLKRYLMYIENDAKLAEHYLQTEIDNLEADKAELRRLEA